jgi:hypothetical protein
MQSAQRTYLLCLACLLTLSGCDSTDSGNSSGVYTVGSTTSTSGTGTGGGSTSPGGFSGAAGGGTSGTKDTVVATPSVPGTVSVTAGASQTVTVTFTSSDRLPIHGLAISSTTLPADWSGADGYNCTLVGNGSSCVLNLTYSPAAAENGTVAINYIFINNAGQEQTPGGTVNIPYAATTTNNVVATSSPIGQVTAALGAGGQPVTVNFTTDDGNAATNLALTTDLSSLPAGWTSTASTFTCAIVSSGNGCQLSLHFAPTAAATGIIALSYTYSDSSGTAQTGTLNVPYSTTTDGTVAATLSPAGQVNAVEKTGNQSVTITFNTDDGRTASNLMLLSKLTALPAGWTAASNSLSCGSVSGGNGCQLTLNYAPTTLTSGTLSLNYSYLDAGGTYNVGSFNVPYAATTNDNVVGTAAPSGQVSAIVGEVSPTVAVTFTTDDGRPATALEVTTSLAALPGGWTSSASTFTCSGINAGTTECVLPLTFTPTVAENGSLALAYKYSNDAGEAKTGTVNIPYVATTNNTVDATASLNILSVLTGTTTPITITFVTDDGNPASALTVTGLSPLPAGWSSGSSTFTCASITTGTGCQISLSYAPTLADSGSLALGFSYTNNSGIAKTGSIAIQYTASAPPPPPPPTP